MTEPDKALGSGAKDKYDTPEEQAAADLLDGVDRDSTATPPPASATENSGTTSANAGTTEGVQA